MTAGLGSGVINVLANTANFENSLNRSFKRIAGNWAKIGALAGGVAGADFIGGAVTQALALEKQVGRIKTLLDNPARDGGLFSPDKIRAVSNEVGIAATDVANATYLALSSGIKVADALDVVKNAAKDTIGGEGDLTTTTDFLTSAINGYGKAGIDAAKASDILFQTLADGKAPLNDIAKYSSTVIPIASQLGIKLQDVMAIASASTLTGTSFRKVTTGMKVGIQELSNTTKGAGKVFKEQLGVGFQDYIKNGHTLQEAYINLTKKVGANNLTKVFGAKEGAQEILTFINQLDKMPQINKDFANNAGAAQKAYETVDATVARSVDRLKIYFSNFRANFGESLLPAVSQIVKFFVQYGPTVQKFFVDNIQKPIEQLKPYWDMLVGDAKAVFAAIAAIHVGGIFDALKVAVEGALIVLAPLFLAFNFFATTVLPAMAGPLNEVIGVLDKFAPVLAGIAAGYVTWKLVAEAALAIEKLKDAWLIISFAATWAYATAVDFLAASYGTASAAGGVFAGVMAVVDAVLEANPIGIVITALVALGVAFYVAWTKSETFRDVVRDTWNAIVTAVGIGVKAFVDLMALYAEAPLRAFDLVLKGLANLPSWLGGGVAAGAEGAVSALIGQIESWRNSAISAIDDVVNAAKLIPSQFGDGSELANADFGYGDNEAAKITQMLKDQGLGTSYKTKKVSIPKTPNLNKPEINPTGGGSGDTAASAAKAAAAAHKAAMKTLTKDMDKFADLTGKSSVSKIETMINKIKADYKALGEKVPKSIKKIEDALDKAAKAQAKNSDGLKTAKANLKTLTDAAAQYHDTLKATTTLDITGLGSVDEIKFRMGQMLAATKTFITNIQKLKAEHLSPTLLQQLVDAGPLSGGAAAAALASANLTDIGSINSTQTQLEGLGDQLGTIGVASFKQAGINMAQGIVQGFLSQEALLDKTITDLGNKMPKTFAKSIKAHSPSRVFMDQSKNIVDGLVSGIDTHGYKAMNAVSSLGDSLGIGGGAGASTLAPTASGGATEVHVYIGDQELTGLVTQVVVGTNRTIKRSAKAGSRSGVVAGSRGM